MTAGARDPEAGADESPEDAALSTADLLRTTFDLAEQVATQVTPEDTERSLDAVLRRAGAAPASITCPRCGATSYHPTDRVEGYCGACHDWTSSRPSPPPVDLITGQRIHPEDR